MSALMATKAHLRHRAWSTAVEILVVTMIATGAAIYAATLASERAPVFEECFENCSVR